MKNYYDDEEDEEKIRQMILWFSHFYIPKITKDLLT